MDIFNYSPRTSHVVHVGQSTLGGESPLRLQSMTTTLRPTWPAAWHKANASLTPEPTT